MNDSTPIVLKINVGQTNQILAALAKQPFETVVEIIGIIRQQAQEQVNAPVAEPVED